MNAKNVEQIYTGSWIDWSKGRVLGAMLTLSSRNAAALSAFLSIFIVWIGTHWWAITRFILHSLRSSNEARDGLYHQQQAIVRNSEAPGGSLYTLLMLIWSWRKSNAKPIIRTVPLVIAASIHMALFAAAGILVSWIGEPGVPNPVLLSPRNCGSVNPGSLGTDSTNPTKWGSWWIYLSALLTTGLQYTRACYAGDVVEYTDDPRCQYFFRQTIGTSFKNESAVCPFQDSMCVTGSALQLDTGHISSDDLGINSRPSDRLWLRKITTSSPLNMTGRTQKNGNVIEYWLGPSFLPAANTPFTASGPLDEFGRGYFLSYRQARREDDQIHGRSGFVPIPELSQDGADMGLLELRNYQHFLEAVEDPLFSAHRPSNTPQGKFVKDDVATFLGVTEQFQLCSSVSPAICSALDFWQGKEDLGANLTFLGLSLSSVQEAIARQILASAVRTSISLGIASFAGPEILLANNFRQGRGHDTSVGLPEYQWMNETENLHNFTLTLLQELIAEVPGARKIELEAATHLSTLDFDDPPEYESTNLLCDMIKVQRHGFVSFSLLGIGMVFGVGGFVILLNWFLADLVNARWQKKSSPAKRKAKASEWINNEFLQLQRGMYEGRNISPWERLGKEVPVPKDRALKWKSAEDAGFEMREQEHSDLLHQRQRDEEHEWSDSGSQSSRVDSSLFTHQR